VHRTVLLLLLAGLLAPASAAQACDVVQVASLETELPAAPTTVAAGRTLVVPVRVTRGGVAAGGIDVFAALDGTNFSAYRSGVTAEDGTAALTMAVPRGARGALVLDVQAHRTLVDLPCAGVEEYVRDDRPWGKVR
jgi:hypothetical protein